MFKDIESLITYLDEQYPKSNDPTNYGKLLKSMMQDKSIKHIMSTCEKISKEISSPPYECHCNPLLLSYFDNCVLECYKRREDNSIESFCEAYINIRKEKTIKNKIKEIAIERGIDVYQITSELDDNLKKLDDLKTEIEKYEVKSNGYFKLYPQIKDVASYLNDHHYLYNKTSALSIYFKDGLFIDKWLQRIDEEKSERKATILGVIIGVIIIILIGYLLSGVDSTVMNWIIAILVLLALLK